MNLQQRTRDAWAAGHEYTRLHFDRTSCASTEVSSLWKSVSGRVRPTMQNWLLHRCELHEAAKRTAPSNFKHLEGFTMLDEGLLERELLAAAFPPTREIPIHVSFSCSASTIIPPKNDRDCWPAPPKPSQCSLYCLCNGCQSRSTDDYSSSRSA